MSREAEVSITPEQHGSALKNFKFQSNQTFEYIYSEGVPLQIQFREQILYKHIDELINTPVFDPIIAVLGLLDILQRK